MNINCIVLNTSNVDQHQCWTKSKEHFQKFIEFHLINLWLVFNVQQTSTTSMRKFENFHIRKQIMHSKEPFHSSEKLLIIKTHIMVLIIKYKHATETIICIVHLNCIYMSNFYTCTMMFCVVSVFSWKLWKDSKQNWREN